MATESRVNATQSIGVHFRFLCFLREEGGNQAGFSRRSNYFFQWIFLIAVLIFLQYSYNTSYYYYGHNREHIPPKNESNVTKCTERVKFTLNRSLHYHQRIMSYKRFMSMNYRFINLGEPEQHKYYEGTPVCGLNVSKLGPFRVNKRPTSVRWLEMQNSMRFVRVRAGGFYAPVYCRARHKVAILIPYRNRERNLAILLYNLHPLLQMQRLQYRIFVVEQFGYEKFNKGALYNVAFLESQRFGTWHCYIFHDVDLVPQDERILYSCPRKPTHMSAAVESMDYKLHYAELFGGVTAMTPQQYLKVNGYSNSYWNWGAEDDDMFVRLQASRLPVLRYNISIARYTTLPHKKNDINPYRYKYLGMAKRRFRYEGLSTLEYKLISMVKEKLYTHILADVNPFNYEDS